MSTPSRSDALVSTALASAGCSKSGVDVFKWMINPYGDNPENIPGYCDDCMSDSVVQVVKQSIQISAPPASVTAATNWDCHVVQLPFANSVGTMSWVPNVTPSGTGFPPGTGSYPDTNSFNIVGSGTGSQFAGGLTIMAGPAGVAQTLVSNNNWSATAGVTAGATAYRANLPLADSFSSGTCRIFASGWEVHNTTNDLAKQGTVTVYRQPVPNQTMASFSQVNAGTTPNILATTQNPLTLFTPHPPTLLSDAMLYPNSKQWEARDGVYAVDMFHDTDIKPQGPYFTQPLFTVAASGASTSYIGTNPQCAGSGNQNQMVGWPDVFWTQREQTGAWFTGLSPNTTLTINVIHVIERFPTIGDDPNLLVVANLSAEKDEKALALYTKTVRKLPVAVPVCQNTLGDWIQNAAETLMIVARPVIRASRDPLLNGALTAGDVIYQLGKRRQGKNRGRGAPKPYENVPSGNRRQGNTWVGPVVANRLADGLYPTPSRPPPIPPRPPKGPHTIRVLPPKLPQKLSKAVIQMMMSGANGLRALGKHATKNARKRANKRMRGR